MHLSVEADQRLNIHCAMMGMDRSTLVEKLIQRSPAALRGFRPGWAGIGRRRGGGVGQGGSGFWSLSYRNKEETKGVWGKTTFPQSGFRHASAAKPLTAWMAGGQGSPLSVSGFCLLDRLVGEELPDIGVAAKALEGFGHDAFLHGQHIGSGLVHGGGVQLGLLGRRQ